MRLPRIVLVLAWAGALLLTACGLPGQSAPTPPPIIIVASPTPQQTEPPAAQPTSAAGQPTAAPAPTSAAGQPTAAPRPTSAGPAPTVPAGSASKGTITFAFDAFPTYYPGILIETAGLLKKRGY